MTGLIALTLLLAVLLGFAQRSAESMKPWWWKAGSIWLIAVAALGFGWSPLMVGGCLVATLIILPLALFNLAGWLSVRGRTGSVLASYLAAILHPFDRWLTTPAFNRFWALIGDERPVPDSVLARLESADHVRFVPAWYRLEWPVVLAEVEGNSGMLPFERASMEARALAELDRIDESLRVWLDYRRSGGPDPQGIDHIVAALCGRWPAEPTNWTSHVRAFWSATAEQRSGELAAAADRFRELIDERRPRITQLAKDRLESPLASMSEVEHDAQLVDEFVSFGWPQA